MGHRHDRECDVERLLCELCTELGFCLPPEDIRRLCASPPSDVDAFTDAVFEAEGMGDMHFTNLHRQVREVVGRHMRAWPLRGEDVDDVTG